MGGNITKYFPIYCQIKMESYLLSVKKWIYQFRFIAWVASGKEDKQEIVIAFQRYSTEQL